MDCRFFTLFAVAGSLLGSFLCYVEVIITFFNSYSFYYEVIISKVFNFVDLQLHLQGCFLILESYMKYFHALSQGLEMGHLLQLLIEAIGNYSSYLTVLLLLCFSVLLEFHHLFFKKFCYELDI